MWRLSRIMFEKAKHNARAGLDVKDELLEALAIAKKVRVFVLDVKDELLERLAIAKKVRVFVLDVKDELLEALAIAKKVQVCTVFVPLFVPLFVLTKIC